MTNALMVATSAGMAVPRLLNAMQSRLRKICGASSMKRNSQR